MDRHSNKTNEKQVGVEEKPKSVVDQWAEYSNEIHSYEEIKKNAIYDSTHNSNELCYSYICQSQQFTESQIEELIVITSQLYAMMTELTPENMSIALAIISCGYRKDKQQKVIDDILSKGTISDKAFSEKLQSKPIPAGGYSDKLDWSNLVKYQNLSSEFISKYRNLIRSGDTTPHTKNMYASSTIVKARAQKARKRKRPI